MKTVPARARFLGWAALAGMLAACGDTSSTSVEPLPLVETEPPFTLSDPEARFYEAIAYGPHEETVFDIFVPDAAGDVPLTVHYHGGGFTGGSRTQIYGSGSRAIDDFLDAGIAFATCDYRLLAPVDDQGVIKSLSDSRRCLQFIRLHAEQLGIDPTRVVLRGGSAGAGTALWLAFHDDMADPASADPVRRESTRVRGAIAFETQGTYDIPKWETVVFREFEVPLIAAAEAFGLARRLLSFLGISEVSELDAPETLAYRANVDMLGLMTADDPPFWVANANQAPEFPVTVGALFHHPFHARALLERADEVGTRGIFYIPQLDIADPTGETDFEFAVRMLD